jgi:hypothetical protein
MGKIQKIVESKSPDLETTNLKDIIKKGLMNKPLTQSQHKILAEFFINIIPDLAKNDVLNKILREIKNRKDEVYE